MSVEQEIANLTSATTALLAAVNERKTVLDAAVDTAGLSAADAGAQAAAAAVALSNAQAAASLAEGHAASASSVVQQDLSGVTAAALHRSPNPVTALFVYDTSKDSDGGAWTEKCQHTSWWNEDLCGKWLGARASEAAARAVAGATTGDYFQLTTDGKFYKLNATSGVTEVFRGNKRDFPRLAGIVAEAANVTIYDLTEPGRPMWMVFRVSSDISSIVAVNGNLVVGSSATYGRAVVVNFVRDTARAYRGIPSTNNTQGDLVGNIARRQTSSYDNTQYRIANDTVNAVAMTVLPDAPIDPVTGLAVPTIALATSGGISVIQNDGTVRSSGSASSFTSITLSPKLLSAGRADANWYYAPNPAALGSAFPLSTRTAGQAPGFGVGNTDGLISPARNRVARRSGAVVQRMLAYESDLARSLVATIGNGFNTGQMLGDIRRAYLADNAVGSVTGPELVTNGDFSNGTTGWSTATAGSLLAAVSGELEVTNGTAVYASGHQRITVVVGKTYKIEWAMRRGTAGSVTLYYGPQLNTGSGLNTTATTPKTFVRYYTATSTTLFVSLSNQTNSIGQTGYLDNISVREVVADRSYKASGASIAGALTAAPVATAAELVAYSGFSAANYLREPYSSDLDFGTGEWSCSAWVNVPTKLPVGSFPEISAELMSNGDFSSGATLWTTQDGTTPATVANGEAVLGSSMFIQQSGREFLSGVYKVTVVLRSSGGIVQLKADMATGPWLAGAQTIYSTAATAFDAGTVVTFYANVTSGKSVLAFKEQNGTGGTIHIDSVSARRIGPSILTDRGFTSGAKINLGVDAAGRLTATADDGTTTRTVTTAASYNTGTPLKVRSTYTTDGTLAILVNGVEFAATRGAPLASLSNPDAVLTIGNSYALDAPFPGSIALLKFSATVPTPEQSVWMYEQEKQLFRAGAKCCLPDSGALVDLTYDEATDKWIAASASNVSEWSGLVRTNVTPVPAGAYSKLAAGGGVVLQGRTTTSPGVDVTIPAYGLREELVKRSEAAAKLNAQGAVFDYVGGFTASTTSGSTAITDVSGLSYPTSAIGAQVTGAGIPAGTAVQAISGTTGYLSKPATATASNVQVSFTDFVLPVGYEARAVSVDGVIKQEGTTKAYTRLFDGFRETIRFAVAPGHQAWVQINVARSAA